MHGRNGLKFAMLMHLDHHQTWFDFGHGLWNFLFLSCLLCFKAAKGRQSYQIPRSTCSSLIMWYPKNWKRQILTYEKHPVAKQGCPWLLCSETSLVKQAFIWIATVNLFNTLKSILENKHVLNHINNIYFSFNLNTFPLKIVVIL